MLYQHILSLLIIGICVATVPHAYINGNRKKEICKKIKVKNCNRSKVQRLCPNKCAIFIALNNESNKYANPSNRRQKESEEIFENDHNEFVTSTRSTDEIWCQYAVDNIKDCEKPVTQKACPQTCKSKGFGALLAKEDKAWCKIAVQLPECKSTFIKENCPDLCSSVYRATEIQAERCGEIIVSDRIVGGNISQMNEYPWVVGFFRKYSYNCGGSLLNENYVLTASHCFRHGSVNDFFVTIGDHDLRSDSETENFLRNISTVILHKGFDKPIPYANDIALVKLMSPVSLSNKIMPICLPPLDGYYDHVDATIVGWGAKSFGHHGADVLREAIVQTMPNSVCKKTPSRNWLYRLGYKDWICAGRKEGKVDTCQGDSGGPLMTIENGRYIQIGVTSWGSGCALKGNPGVYQRVTNFLDWINTNMNEETQCKEGSDGSCHLRLEMKKNSTQQLLKGESKSTDRDNFRYHFDEV